MFQNHRKLEHCCSVYIVVKCLNLIHSFIYMKFINKICQIILLFYCVFTDSFISQLTSMKTFKKLIRTNQKYCINVFSELFWLQASNRNWLFCGCCWASNKNSKEKKHWTYHILCKIVCVCVCGEREYCQKCGVKEGEVEKERQWVYNISHSIS